MKENTRREIGNEKDTLEREVQKEPCEPKRLESEAEKKPLEKEREMKEKHFERELEAKLQSEKLVAQLELKKLQLKKARMEHKTIETQAEVPSAAPSQAGRVNVAAVTKTSGLPAFMDRKDNLDNYLLRLKRYATIAGSKRDTWAVLLSSLFISKALDIYSGLSSDDVRDYDKLRKALLQRYDFTAQGYCDRFKNAKPEGQESPGQLIVRISNYFNKWEELSEVGKTFEGVEELMVREQFTNSCPRDVSIFLNERKPKNFGRVGSKWRSSI